MRHLTSEQIQEFLDRALSPQEEARVQQHLSACPRCQSEMEGWSLLFSELGSLPEMSPGPAFSREVMARVEVREPWSSRLKSWITAWKPQRAAAHLPPETIQDLLEDLLPSPQAAEAGAHLESCHPCQEAVKGWERVFGALGALGRFAPSPGFAERVMARVRVPVPAPALWSPDLPGRVWARARALLPRTRRGWAVVGGVASAPSITLAALIYLVFSNSILTVESLVTYVSWKASALSAALFSGLADRAVESVALFKAYSILETIANSPLLLSAGGLTFSLLSAGALWVLYRNLIVAPSDDPYARAQV